MFDFALANNGLLDAANRARPCHRRDFDRQLQTDLVVWMDAGRNVNVDTDIDIRELRVYKRIYRG